MFSRVMALVAAGATVLTLAVVPAAHADNKRFNSRTYGNPGPGYDYARVLNVEPIVRQVRIETPQRECWTEDRYREPPRRHGSVAGSMILGGLIGGVIGSQFGNGDGRRAATAAGALIGSSIGHDAGERRRAAQARYEPTVRSVERCAVRYVDNYEERIEGYDVEYEYAGQRRHTRMSYDPGERLRIRVDVSPVYDRYGNGRNDNGRYEDDDEEQYEDGN